MESSRVGLFEQAIRAGGGQYVGVQRGSREKGIPDLVLFNDPLTHTTLAFRAGGGITEQTVRAKIAHSRTGFARYHRLAPLAEPAPTATSEQL